jgi:hypothetical protein
VLAAVERKGFLGLAIDRNDDSEGSPDWNKSLSDHHIISRKIDFFDSIDPKPTSAGDRSAIGEALTLVMRSNRERLKIEYPWRRKTDKFPSTPWKALRADALRPQTS